MDVAETLPPPRPLFNAYSLPLPRRRQGRAAALSLLAHGAAAVLVLWRGAAFVQGGGGGTGPRGGGGGGGRPAVAWFTLPAMSAPQAIDVPAAPALTALSVALPDPVKIELPLEPTASLPSPSTAAAPVGTGTGTSGGPGQGPGSGGGQGTGAGPGSGSDAGPGSGGEAGYIPADVRGLIVPPDCAKGRFLVRFWVEADGRVSRVDVDPPPRDAGCRREMLAQMKAYQFRPATRSGQPVASVYPIRLIH